MDAILAAEYPRTSGLGDADFWTGARGVVGTGGGKTESGSPHGSVNPPSGPASLASG